MSIDKRGIFMNSGLKNMARREVARKLQTINSIGNPEETAYVV